MLICISNATHGLGKGRGGGGKSNKCSGMIVHLLVFDSVFCSSHRWLAWWLLAVNVLDGVFKSKINAKSRGWHLRKSVRSTRVS